MNREPMDVAVLGATGMVGQRLVSMLDGHPWFRVAELFASPRSAGRPYAEAVPWRLPCDPPAAAARLEVRPLEEAASIPLAFSGLGSDVAGPAEDRLAEGGCAVVSNASAHRMDPDVPLLIPEVNPDHLAVLEAQKKRRGGPGFLVTNPNCSTIGLTLALAPIHHAFGLRRVSVVTLQALSGAGWPGVPSLAVADNVVPWIGGEVEKIESEPQKILGEMNGDGIRLADFAVGARVHRVPVSDGHMLSVSLETDRPASPGEVADVLEAFRGEPQDLGLPSAPERPVHVLRQPDRPQPALDRDRDGGMAVSVGGIETCPALGIRMEILSHNTVRGAAGAAILNAELLVAKGYLK